MILKLTTVFALLSAGLNSQQVLGGLTVLLWFTTKWFKIVWLKLKTTMDSVYQGLLLLEKHLLKKNDVEMVKRVENLLKNIIRLGDLNGHLSTKKPLN